ncbi:MAG: TetR/AcrR family transcriptional regulator [Flavobacteriales bacterium]|uniref:TetR/AcrR family transcriptional regulator n=1 Tax=Candidatus Ulvibacter alkanivorans TaxID=2267620 RepID=UPI000DF43433|nr:TetR/AcrR family transcriptional regulator [Candidatus Ulvibacter alkanivorans]MCH2490234.1 TetR/AcrR family transcriptional regulator [Flavobacteriales bacterium]
MRNATATRQTILLESANLFNTQGYKATSISDITKATGLTKGAIYRHFESKQDLEQQALRELSKLMFQEIRMAIRNAPTFEQKFEAIFSFFEKNLNTSLYEGGCPLLNAAVEGDDANPLLRMQAFNMLGELKMGVATLIQNGIDFGQVKPTVDVDFYCTVVVATLEGGIMMSKLEGTDAAIKNCISHLRNTIATITI